MYIQLNTKTGYSFYESSILIEEYVTRAKDLKYTYLGINDGNVYAFPSFSIECEKNNLRPIYGIEINLANSNGTNFKASLYIKNEEGYLNLCKLLSKKKDIIGISLLKEYSKGLILVIQTDIDFFQEGFLSLIKKDFFDYRKIFTDDFYFGIALYSKIDVEEAVTFYDFVDKNEYKVIPFPKVEYIHKKDAYKTNILKASKDFDKNNEEIPQIEKEGPYFFLSENIIEKLYRKQDLANFDYLVSTIDFVFFKKRGNLIKIENDNQILVEKTTLGLQKKLKTNSIQKDYQDRLDYELSVIEKMNFSSYFLIVEDYVSYAKKVNIKVGPGRGSAGGSLVAFALDITQVDPIRFDLTFERFLNPYRVTMPDIDIDFEDERRNEVVTYLKQKYGEERISTIITFVKLKPKSVLNKIGPILGVNENRLKKITSSISKDANTFNEALKSDSFKNLISDSYYKDLCSTASSLLSLPINTSIHAPGIIIADNPIYLTCPMSEGKNGTVCYEYAHMEKLGFLKMDILALSNLTFIRKIEERILSNKKNIPSIYDDLDNQEVYKTLNDLNLLEIFQLDTSYGMKETISKIKPNSFSDLAATIALFRPGPMAYISSFANRKHGLEKITYEDDRLKDILSETYGIIVYQEQIMKILQTLASFTLGEADLIRRAISKKDKSKIESYKEKFILGCINNQITKEKAISIFSDIERFAEYGFNKSHAYSYGLITYTLLYYKTFFFEEFYQETYKSISLNSNDGNDLVNEISKKNIKLNIPSINISDKNDLIFINQKAYLPISSVCSNETLLNKIIEERKKSNFVSLYDFVTRTYSELAKVDKNVINKMIDGGLFDEFSTFREGIKETLKDYLNCARFSMDESLIEPIKKDNQDIIEKLYFEKCALGRIISKSISKLSKRKEYRAFFVSDVSSLEMSNIFAIDDESSHYLVKYPKKIKLDKYDVVLLKGYFPHRKTFAEVNEIQIIRKKGETK